MRRSALTCAALLAVACQKTVIVGSGVVVVVVVDPQVKADCIGVAAVKTSGGTEQVTPLAKREDRIEFAVGSGPGLDGEISVVARGFLGANCSTPGVLNAQSPPGTITFKEGSASETLMLEISGALDDDDGDGYRASSKGGTDCDPGNAAINPGEVELCSDGIDNDCSGVADCADRAGCEGHACQDGNACSTGETCVNAVCTPPQAPCTSPPNPCYATAGACSDGGTCLYTVVTGSPCDGGTCRSDGVCAQGETLCDDGVDNDHNGSTDCGDTACLNQQCNDGNPCTTPDRCGAGSCAGQPLVCNTPPASPCVVQDAGVCVAGDCQYLARAGASCDDGLPCTVGDTCNADAGCAGQPKMCSGVYDGGCSAATGTCNPADGTCQFGAAPAGTACDDLDGCTSMDHCGDAGACQGAAITCVAPACQVPVGCMGGSCMFTNVDAGTPCDGGACFGGVCSVFSYVPSNFNPSVIAPSDWSGNVHLTGGCVVTFSSSGAGTFTNSCGLTLPAAKQVSLSDGNLALLLPFGSLTIDAPSTLALTGDKPVILAVKGDATVQGLITASSVTGTPGAGANAAGCSAGPAGAGVTVTIPGGAMGSGGGGGAFATAGTAGGQPADGGSPTAGAGGLPNGGGALVPLRGGCAGAAGGHSGNAQVCTPGAGGGAVQLSVAGMLTMSGHVAASGSGGPAGPSASVNPNSGGGGGCGAGSGGAILLEARAVNLAGAALLTNGGGGGEGGSLQNPGNDGSSGSTATATAAAGGDLGNTNGGKGGNGAAGRVGMGTFVPAGAAVDGTNQGGGGGGGGGVGRVRVNAVQSCEPPTTVSGDITFNMSCP